jgi:N-methylhydantoinase A/oxoprolinase/acetone carboxylase beta subunit
MPGDGLPGLGPLDTDAARRALSGAGVDPAGVIAVVDDAMVQAIRVVSVQRGVDPTGLALVAFGGAGPLHACALADALGMPAVVVPPRAGVLSAVGLLGARRQVDLVRSWERPGDRDGLARALDDLAAEGRRRLGRPAASIVTATDCRYAGQGHEITVPAPDDFEAEHERRNGFVMTGSPVEVVALRVVALGPAEVDLAALPGPDRRGTRRGPTVIAEADCTIWVGDGWTARVHESGSWILTRDSG